MKNRYRNLFLLGDDTASHVEFDTSLGWVILDMPSGLSRAERRVYAQSACKCYRRIADAVRADDPSKGLRAFDDALSEFGEIIWKPLPGFLFLNGHPEIASSFVECSAPINELVLYRYQGNLIETSQLGLVALVFRSINDDKTKERVARFADFLLDLGADVEQILVTRNCDGKMWSGTISRVLVESCFFEYSAARKECEEIGRVLCIRNHDAQALQVPLNPSRALRI